MFTSEPILLTEQAGHSFLLLSHNRRRARVRARVFQLRLGAGGDSLAEAHDFFIPLIPFSSFTAVPLRTCTAHREFRPFNCLVSPLLCVVVKSLLALFFYLFRRKDATTVPLKWRSRSLRLRKETVLPLNNKLSNNNKKKHAHKCTNVPIELKSHMVRH